MFLYKNKCIALSAVCALTLVFTSHVLASEEVETEREVVVGAQEVSEIAESNPFIEKMLYSVGTEEYELEELHQSRNINILESARSENEVFTSKLYPISGEISVFIRQWKNNDTKPEKIELHQADGSYLINLFNNISDNDAGYAELTIQPEHTEDEKPVTYVFRQVLEAGKGQHPFIQNIKLEVDNSAHCEDYHGKLLAVDDKFEDTLNLGYGFLATRTNYIVNVPWSVNSIDFSVEKLNIPNDTTQVSINGISIENRREITTHLEGEETLVKVIGTSVNGNEVVYTIKIIREDQPYVTIFTDYFVEGSLYVVSETGKVYYPTAYESNKAKFYLPIGRTYTYYYEVPGQVVRSKSFKLQEAVVKNREISLPSL